MAVYSDYSGVGYSAFLERAKQMKIPIWSTDILWDSEKMRETLKDII